MSNRKKPMPKSAVVTAVSVVDAISNLKTLLTADASQLNEATEQNQRELLRLDGGLATLNLLLEHIGADDRARLPS